MPWIEIQDQDIYYVEAGPEDESVPAIVFLHGMSSCGEAWWQQFGYFSSKYRVYAFDSVNHGHSSNSQRDQEEPDRTDELEAFLTAKKISQPILAGNSMGGATILRWASRHPGDAKALIISGMGVAEPGQSTVREVRPLDNDTLFLPVGQALTSRLKQERPRMFERYLRIRSTATRLEYLRHPRPRNAKTISETTLVSEAIQQVTSPMLVIIGSLDGLIPNAERLHALVPHSQYAVIEGAPHNVYWEAAIEWNETVAEFLDSV